MSGGQNHPETGSNITVVAFDINETLLDLSVLDDQFANLFGTSLARRQWFAQMLQLSFVGGLTGEYIDFSTAQHGALQMLADQYKIEATDRQLDAIVDSMSNLPPHPEVADALATLASKDVTIAALGNSLYEVIEAQLTNAGILEFFNLIFSADSVKALKPAPQPYIELARVLGVQVNEIVLVASHGWDISGALAAGCTAAFVARPGASLSPFGMQPSIVGRDIADVVNQIIADQPERKS